MSRSGLSARDKSIAVGSGKGGVGKTTTSVNLALYYAKTGLKVALIDLDPLSDVASLLGLHDPESAFAEPPDQRKPALSEFTVHLFANLDLIFPRSKLRSEQIEEVKDLLFRRFRDELAEAYDLLVFDLPAGSRYEDNLSYLPFMGRLLVVTASEPTAHVSTGGYIRSVLDSDSDVRIDLWHNRYTPRTDGRFDPRDVLGNYNRNVLDEQRIGPQTVSRIRDLAFIPPDPTLDLLQDNPSLMLYVQRNILDLLLLVHRQRLLELLREHGFSSKSLELVLFFLTRRRRIDDVASCIDELEDFLRAHLSSPAEGDLFSPSQKEELADLLRRMRKDTLRVYVLRVSEQLERDIERKRESRRPFQRGEPVRSTRGLDRLLTRLLLYLGNSGSRHDPFLRNVGGMLVFYFALMGLLQSKTVVRLIGSAVPIRKNSRGERVRDRFRQIRNLTENDRLYRQRIMRLTRTLFPILIKQILTVVRTFKISGLTFRSGGKELNREVYLRLFHNFIHEMLNSGLSVIVGFRHRPASRAFSEAADRLLREIRLEQPRSA